MDSRNAPPSCQGPHTPDYGTNARIKGLSFRAKRGTLVSPAEPQARQVTTSRRRRPTTNDQQPTTGASRVRLETSSQARDLQELNKLQDPPLNPDPVASSADPASELWLILAYSSFVAWLFHSFAVRFFILSLRHLFSKFLGAG